MSKLATDILRIFSITFIIINHTGWWFFSEVGTYYERELSHVIAWMNQLGKPSVLFFIFLSGYAFGRHRLNQNFDTGRFYLHRFLRIWIPYFLVSVIYYLDNGTSADHFWWGILTGAHKYHLYFIPLISILYAIFPLLRKIPFSWNYLFMFFGVLVMVHIFASDYQDYPIFLGWQTDFTDAVFASKYYNMEPYEMLIFSLFFFQLGLWSAREGKMPGTEFLEKHISVLSKTIFRFVLLLIFFGWTILDYYMRVSDGMSSDPAGRIWRIPVVFYAISVIFFMQNMLTRIQSDIIGRLSRASFLVYLIHPFILDYFRLWDVPILCLSVIIVSWVLGYLATIISGKSIILGILLGDGDKVLRKYLVK
jgi:surface polysaccharide O-acyltransferase-like enzyme